MRLIVIFASLACLLGSRTANAAPQAAPLGEIYPGGRMSSPPEAKGCGGHGYTYDAEAPVKKIADFYLAEAARAGLPLIGDKGDGDSGPRLLAFGEKGPGRVLSVTISHFRAATRVRVYYVVDRPHTAGCL